MNKIKGCIFDLDGVIVDTAKYHFLAWKALADELGFEFTENDNEALKGISRQASLEKLLEIGNIKISEEKKIELMDKKNNIYVEYISKLTKTDILPGVESFLKTLKENDFKIALGSVSKNAVTILNGLELMNYFDAIIDGTKIKNGKPDPEVFLLGAKEMNLSSSQCVVFEDAVSGIEGALNANMKAIGVGEPLILSKAHKVISGFNNITLEILNFN